MDKPTLCSFAGYVSEAGGKDVQEWYDGLPEAERDEVKDTFNYLASIPPMRWRRPEFDKLESPLHEIRCKSRDHWIRIYGAFDKRQRGRFIFLYGSAEKKVRNDTSGKKKALERWKLLEQGKATTHEFIVEVEPSPKDSQGQGR